MGPRGHSRGEGADASHSESIFWMRVVAARARVTQPPVQASITDLLQCR